MLHFWAAGVSAFGVTLLTELGDKTFFVCALLAAKASRWRVFAGSYLALVVQTFLCAGVAVYVKTHKLHVELSVRWDLLIAGAVLLVFGLWSIWEGWMSEVASSATADPADYRTMLSSLDELEDAPNSGSRNLFLQSTIEPLTPTLSHHSFEDQLSTDEPVFVTIREIGTMEGTAAGPADQASVGSKRLEQGSGVFLPGTQSAISNHPRQTRGPLTQMVIWKAFAAVFAAELGDRSMFSTTALATTQNVWGVCSGALGAHAVCTITAVCCARAVCDRVSERTTHLLAGVIFLVFSFVSFYEAALFYQAYGTAATRQPHAIFNV